jgi:transposase
MRGADDHSDHMFSYVSPESRVRPDHPLRAIRRITDAALLAISPELERLYSEVGRPSIPPEQLLRALVIQVLYSVRSERLLMEEIDYSVLFRWFIGVNLDTPIWSHSTFSKNRDRLLRGDIAGAFFAAVADQARAADLLSDAHFTVDGTTLEAWASLKSFQPRDAPPSDDPDRGNPTVDFKGQPRKNDTHVSRTDPDARLYRKADGDKAVLAYLAHVLLDNRHGLVHSGCATAADGFAEREAATLLLEASGRRRGTVGADRGYNVANFVAAVRGLRRNPPGGGKAQYNATAVC